MKNTAYQIIIVPFHFNKIIIITIRNEGRRIDGRRHAAGTPSPQPTHGDVRGDAGCEVSPPPLHLPLLFAWKWKERKL